MQQNQIINQLVYGAKFLVSHRKSKGDCLVFLCPQETRLMRFVSLTKDESYCIDLTQIVQIGESTEKIRLKLSNGDYVKVYKGANAQLHQAFEFLVESALEQEKLLNDRKQVYSLALKLMHKSDDNMNSKLSLQEFIFLLGELQIELPEKKILQIFKQYAVQEEINADNIYQILESFSRKDEIYDAYIRYCSIPVKQQDKNESKLMLAADIEQFFLIEQGQKYNPQQQSYNFYEFCNIIMNDNNTLFLPTPLDLNYPITNYLINSSHNTYVEANQLTGVASTKAYIDAFQFGCKCVELDCWDGENGQPVVTHGHTLMSKVQFRDVINAVKDYGFCLDSYPIILSFEMHCSVKQQDIIADILVEILGKSIYIIDDYNRPQFPTLKEMLGKVMIKNKENSHYLEGKITKITEITQLSKSMTQAFQLVRQEEEEMQKTFTKSQQVEDGNKYSKKLLDLTSLFGMKLDFERTFIWGITSISEGSILKLRDQKNPLIREYLRHGFLRVYPKGFRFDSSNYSPCPSWEVGAQMVALNTQTKDFHVFINHGRFLNSNYVLKKDDKKTLNFEITIISAQNLKWEELKKNQEQVVDPYIKVRICGHHEDEKNAEKWRTQTIQDNGFHPVFNYKCNIKLLHPNDAILYFQAWSYSILGDSLLGQYSLPVSNIRKGYRIVPLLNSQLEPYGNCKILIHIKM